VTVVRKPPESRRGNRRDLTLVAYDLPDDRRRRRVARLADDVGRRVQKSVFEAWLTPDQVDRLVARLDREIDPDQDRVYLLRCCPACRAEARTLGAAEPPTPAVEFFIL
jgi:CRISPR-associated protein Cas2